VWCATDLQNAATPHQSNQPMDTLIHSQQQEAQHATADSTPAAASKVSSRCCWLDAIVKAKSHSEYWLMDWSGLVVFPAFVSTTGFVA